jgi:hypothetical protein
VEGAKELTAIVSLDSFDRVAELLFDKLLKGDKSLQSIRFKRQKIEPSEP